MALFWTLVIGFAVGLIARMVMPGRDPGGFVVMVLLGCAGGYLGRKIGQSLAWFGSESGGYFAAMLGAILFVALYRLFLHRFFSWATGGRDRKRAVPNR